MTPWHPFPTEADFDFVEFTSRWNLSAAAVDDLLGRLRHQWTRGTSLVTVKNAKEARSYSKEAVDGSLKVSYLPLHRD